MYVFCCTLSLQAEDGLVYVCILIYRVDNKLALCDNHTILTDACVFTAYSTMSAQYEHPHTECLESEFDSVHS